MSLKKKVVFVADLHFGHFAGMLPAKFITSEGIQLPQNSGQKYLWACWLDFCERVKAYMPDAIIINGDVVEGVQRKEGGMGLSLRSMVDQKAAAADGLRVLKDSCPKDTPFYFVQGTDYHVGHNGEAEEDVAGMLGAMRYQSVGSGRLVREVLWLDIDGIIIECSHGIGGASGFYRATALDREMQWSAMSAKDRTKGMPKADLVVRAHLHFFHAGEHASKQGLNLPCWKLQDKFARKSSVHRHVPDIGGVFVDITADDKTRGEPPCRIVKQLYSLPPVPITRLQ